MSMKIKKNLSSAYSIDKDETWRTEICTKIKNKSDWMAKCTRKTRTSFAPNLILSIKMKHGGQKPVQKWKEKLGHHLHQNLICRKFPSPWLHFDLSKEDHQHSWFMIESSAFQTRHCQHNNVPWYAIFTKTNDWQNLAGGKVKQRIWWLVPYVHGNKQDWCMYIILHSRNGSPRKKNTPRNPFNEVINIIKVLTSHFTSNARSQ